MIGKACASPGATYKQNLEMAGRAPLLYVLAAPGTERPCKVGRTIEIKKRVSAFCGALTLRFAIEIEEQWLARAETLAHGALSAWRSGSGIEREFFDLTPGHLVPLLFNIACAVAKKGNDAIVPIICVGEEEEWRAKRWNEAIAGPVIFGKVFGGGFTYFCFEEKDARTLVPEGEAPTILPYPEYKLTRA